MEESIWGEGIQGRERCCWFGLEVMVQEKQDEPLISTPPPLPLFNSPSPSAKARPTPHPDPLFLQTEH